MRVETLEMHVHQTVHAILFPIVHFNIFDSHLTSTPRLPSDAGISCFAQQISLLWFLFFVPKFHFSFIFFAYDSKYVMPMHNIRHGTQISQHQATKNGQCCAKTEKKMANITNDNGHYIVNFFTRYSPVYIFLANQRERVRTRVDTCSDGGGGWKWVSSQKYVKWLSFIKTILSFIYTRI